MNKKEKAGLNIALDILKNTKRYELCWEQMDETKYGEFVKYNDIEKAIIEKLQSSSNNG